MQELFRTEMNDYKPTPPRIKDTGKTSTSVTAKAGRGRGGGNPPKPKASAVNSKVTGVISDTPKVKSLPLNLNRSSISEYNRTNLLYNISTLNGTKLSKDIPNSYGQSASNSGLSFNSTPTRKVSNKLHAQSGSVTNDSNLSTPRNMNPSPKLFSNANLNDCTIFGESFNTSDSIHYSKPYNELTNNSTYLQETGIPLNEQTFEDLDGNKRPISELDILIDGRNEAKRNRGDAPPRLSYATCAKHYVMLEFRASNPKVALKQEDYGNIEAKLAFAYMKLPKPRPETIPKVYQMGLSQGALWCAAHDDFTYQFCLETVPAFETPKKYLPNPLLPPKPKPAKGTKPKKLTPEENALVLEWEIPENELPYTYEVYGPNNKPFRYLKGRFPKDFWCDNHEEFIELLRAFHPKLDRNITDPTTGQQIKYHLRISAGMEDRATEIIGGYFTISLEVEEDLLQVLAEMDGFLTILSTNVKLVGGNIDRLIQEHIDKENKMDNNILEDINDDFEDAMNTEDNVDPAEPVQSTSSSK